MSLTMMSRVKDYILHSTPVCLQRLLMQNGDEVASHDGDGLI